MTARTSQPGLKLRMRWSGRRLSSQHRQLDALYGRIAAALAAADPGAAEDALERFLDAWDAHTQLEDKLYFPALRGLRPNLDAVLAGFAADHRRLRKVLVGVAPRLAAGELEAAAALLDAAAAEISDHEAREERFVAELTGTPE